MPFVSWLDDANPTADLDTWRLRIDGKEFSIQERSLTFAHRVPRLHRWVAHCHHWAVVALSDVLPDRAIRSARVTSSTGCSSLFARDDCDRVYVCTGHAGQPLARHGAPVRGPYSGGRGGSSGSARSSSPTVRPGSNHQCR